MQLPTGPYSNLQYALDSTKHSQNQVIASQDSCSIALSLHEYVSFGSLRADGERTQWLNIARELTAGNLSFDTEAVTALFSQTAWQAGPSSESWCRVAHSLLGDSRFCNELLTSITKRMESTKANWRCDYQLLLLLNTTLRVLSLSSDAKVINTALSLLKSMRMVTLEWTGTLNSLLDDAIDVQRIEGIQQRLIRVSILCKLTYDVGTAYISPMMSDPANLSTWIICCVIIRENLPGDYDMLAPELRRIHLRDLKLTRRLRSKVLDLITGQENQGMNEAMSHIWSGNLPPTTSWSSSANSNGQWVYTSTTDSGGSQSQDLHYNVLSGEFLVNGKPLGKISVSYRRSDPYKRLFGAQILKVFPADIPGMTYVSAQKIQNHTVYFTKREEKVVIRARQGSQTLELIPPDIFIDDLPISFTLSYVHWLDIDTGDIEFRPTDQPWASSLENWQLQYRAVAPSTLRLKDRWLIDVRSKTCAAIMKVLDCLEDWQHIHITVEETRIQITLPRFDLHFLLNNEGQFECLELCKIIDPNQSIGTLIGLRNRLVLSAVGDAGQKYDRIVLVPKGTVYCTKSGHHVEVKIKTQGDKLRLFLYRIDEILGRLKGSSDVMSRLYKTYLHALTSHFLPDPLTGRTGTEEALDSLRKNSNLLREPAEEDVKEIFRWIGELTPCRTYYPQHLRVMQQVRWNSHLPILSQRDSFLRYAQQIMSSGEGFKFLYLNSQPSSTLGTHHVIDLVHRAELRNANFASNNGEGHFVLGQKGTPYAGRERVSSTERAAMSYDVAALVYMAPAKFEVSRGLLLELQNLDNLSGFKETFDTSMALSDLLNISLSESWAHLHQLCRHSTLSEDRFKLLFAFSTVAYGGKINSITSLRTLLAFMLIPDLHKINSRPTHNSFTLSYGSQMDPSKVKASIQRHMSSIEYSSHRLTKAQRREELRIHGREQTRQTQLIQQFYTRQWPCETPSVPSKNTAALLNVGSAHNEIANLFMHWTKNREFKTYINEVQPYLNCAYQQMPISNYAKINWATSINDSSASIGNKRLDLSNLLTIKPPSMDQTPPKFSTESKVQASKVNSKLWSLVGSLGVQYGKTNANSIRERYRKDLMSSIGSYAHHLERVVPCNLPCTVPVARHHLAECEEHLRNIRNVIDRFLSKGEQFSTILQIVDLWPRSTLVCHLAGLSRTADFSIPQDWIPCMLSLGLAITLVQRARRLLLAAERGDVPTCSAELENMGHVGWSPNCWHDWLLIEIENDILIRPNQAEVAIEMLKPASGQNSLTQLNMGEGKSSVIVPMVACALADGAQLSRVIVLKSLTRQMEDTLTTRLGGLLNRPIYYMPFNRNVTLSLDIVRQIQELYKTCKRHHGILLAQPEHILSFQLVGIERLTSGNFEIASLLLQTQTWLDLNVRNLLDESDEIFDVKFQLIYTLGAQRMMDGQPDRWLIAQSLYDLIERHARGFQDSHPGQLEYSRHSEASFPTIRLLSDTVGRVLMSRILDDVMEGQLPALSFEQCPSVVKGAVRRLIEDSEVSDEDCDTVTTHYEGKGVFLQNLLLVLCESRAAFVAMPFGRTISSKGRTRCNCKFGHPDVDIALTCLTYYYTGLTDAQVRQCFELLQKTDDPSLEYSAWTARCTKLPEDLRDWNAVNLEDGRQCLDDLFPAVRHSKKLVDYFLAYIVFPREGKEFDEKLSSSGWDIPSKKDSSMLTTGFSGTNDNRFLLPLSISQCDLENLKHTSGKVLDYVVRNENLQYQCARGPRDQQMTTNELLKFIHMIDSNVRVLIDVGAQVLDVQNIDLVKMWMSIVKDADAGIFFDYEDNPMVLTRDQKLESLAVSSFLGRIDRCLVYLDEVHTRGTDLRLPATARAAVTLGPRLTKDKLVQACMRLRKLAQGQSLMHFAPPEVDKSIRNILKKPDGELDGYDVVAWTLEQSCLGIERAQPLRVMQGLNHHQRQLNMARFQNVHKDLDHLHDTAHTSSLEIIAFREKEKQRLSDLYAPTRMKERSDPGLVNIHENDSDPTVRCLVAIWKALDPDLAGGASVHEEHEREVAHEVERETQIQRPPAAQPAEYVIDRKLRSFITSGHLDCLSALPNAASMIETTSADNPAAAQLLVGLKVTRDFIQTVKRSHSGFNDNYVRPVNFVLSSKHREESGSLCIISQHEVNLYFDEIHSNSSGVKIHMYEPRVTKSMGAVDSPSRNSLLSVLHWQSLDHKLRQELHIFGAQLYFTTYDCYLELRERLNDLSPVERAKMLSWIKDWISIRRKGQNFLPTHLGQMIGNRTLIRETFE